MKRIIYKYFLNEKEYIPMRTMKDMRKMWKAHDRVFKMIAGDGFSDEEKKKLIDFEMKDTFEEIVKVKQNG